jgi:hypothetical protein
LAEEENNAAKCGNDSHNGSVQDSSCTESAALKIHAAGGDSDGSDSCDGDESEIELNSEEAEEMDVNSLQKFLERERHVVADLEAMTPGLNAIEADLSLVRVKVDAYEASRDTQMTDLDARRASLFEIMADLDTIGAKIRKQQARLNAIMAEGHRRGPTR